MTNKEMYKTKSRILLPFAILVFLLITLFIISIEYIMQNQILKDAKQKTTIVTNLLNFEKSHKTELMKSMISTLQKNKDLKKYWLQKDREKLLKTSLKLFKKLHDKIGVTQFYFYDTSGVNFLRVHEPEKYGDYITRHTLHEAISKKSTSADIEIGEACMLSLHVVAPWYINNKLVGFIELDEEIDSIINMIHSTVKVDLLLFYKRKFVEKQQHDNYYNSSTKNSKNNWVQFEDWVLINRPNSIYPSKYLDKLTFKNNTFIFSNNDYTINSIPITNARNEEIAKILVFNNNISRLHLVHSFTFIFTSISIIIAFVLFTLFYIILNNIEKKLTESQKKLLEEAKQKEKIQEEHFKELLKEKEKLLESENRFYTVVTHNRPIVFMLDKDGVVQLSEGKMLANIDLKPGEIVGKNVFDIYKDYPKITSIIKRTLEGETYEGIIEIKDRYLETYYSPNKDSEGNIIGVLGIALDITERKETEDKLKKQTKDLENSNKELKKSRMAALNIMQDANIQKQKAEKALAELEKFTLELQKLSRVIEEVPLSVVITNTKGEIEYTNPHFTKITGYLSEEVKGKKMNIFRTGFHNKEFYQNLWKTITSQIIWKGEVYNKKKNGEKYWEKMSISPIINKDGEITHFVAVKEDITEKKKTEIELKKAKLSAESATKAKSQFLASMSHEIRTPMNAIIGLSHLAKNANPNPKLMDYISKIETSAQSLLRIINDILDFSKIEANKLTLENINFNLENLLSSTASLVSQKIYEKGLELILDIAPNVPLNLVGDPLRIKQIITNFLSNAVKFTENGEIIVTVTMIIENDKTVEILFAVQDSGIGIKDEEKDKLFNAFQQADTSTTRKFGGTGLGLVISKSIAKLMNGDIWFESEENKGSTFYFAASFKKQNHDVNKTFTPFNKLKDMKALLYHQNLTSRKFLTKKLESFMFNVSFSETEEKTLELLKEKKYNLIVIDSEIDKEKFLKTLEQSPNKNVPIIILSKLSDTKNAEEFSNKLEKGVVLIKPILHSDIYNKIIELFDITQNTKITLPQDTNKDNLQNIKDSLVLVVEDNKINQQVIKEILQSINLKVEIANNGHEAIEMVKNSGTPSKYSLVLMDIQMPGMDGFTATAEIKKLKGYNTIPIIAMTADAMEGVKEKCIAAGMSDFLTKPVEPNKIFIALLKWIKPNRNLNYTLSDDILLDPTINENINIPQIDGINTKVGLKYVGGDKELFLNLLQKFYENNNDFENKINKAIENNDRENAIRLIHTLKSNAALLGISELQNITEKAQNELLANKETDVKSFLSEILNKLLPILNSLKNIKLNIQSPKTQNLDSVKEKLIELKTLLELSDSDAISLFKEIGTIKGFENEIKQLDKEINNYRFNKALEILLKIIE